MFIVVRFRDALYGNPIHWVPPCITPSPIPPASALEPPTSLGKRRGGCNGVGISEQVQVFELEPTTLKRGEGLVSGCRVCLRAKWVARAKGGGSGMGGGQAKLNRDGVDVRFKLRLPS